MNVASHQVRTEHVVGTAVSVRVRAARDAACAFEDIAALLQAIDRRWRGRRPASGEGRQHEGTSDQVPELAALVEHGSDLRVRTAVLARTADSLDPTLWIVGCTVDRVGALLSEHGFEDWMIDVGGDVLVNAPDDAEAWRIAVPHPIESAAVTVLHARHLAVAPSGGQGPLGTPPAAAPESTTVCGPSLAAARALSASAFALGPDGPAMVASHPGYECWTALSERRVVTTLGFPRATGRPLLTATPDRTGLRSAA